MKNIFTLLKGFIILIVFGFTINQGFASSNALSFDGNDDYVGLGTSSLLRPTTAVTLEFWASCSNWTGQGSKTLAGNTQTGGYAIAITSSQVYFIVRRNNTYGYAIYTSTGNLGAGWHHFAGTFDGEYARLYIDGLLVATNDAGGTYPIQYSLSNGFIIGAEAGSGTVPDAGTNFAGSIDEVRIWNVARSQSDIFENFDCEMTVPTGNLIANYNFDQGTAGGSNPGVTTLTDASGNGITGTLVNFALSGSSSNWVSSFVPVQMKMYGNGILIPAGGTGTPSVTNNTDFCNVNIGAPVTKSFSIKSFNSDLIISGVVLLFADSLHDFSWTSSPPLPLTLHSGETSTFYITFNPQTTGTRIAYCNIINNDCSHTATHYHLNLEGIGMNSDAVNLTPVYLCKHDSISLRWTWTSANPPDFILQRSPDSLFNTVVNITVSASARKYAEIPPSAGRWYYRIRPDYACNNALWSPLSHYPSAVYNPNLTGVITLFNATKGEYQDKVMLTWTYNDFGVQDLYQYYEIRRSAENDTVFANSTVIASGIAKTYTNFQADNTHISGFVDKTVMRYWIRPYNTNCGTTIYSTTPKNDLGFSNPTATLNGQVTYFGSSQGVPNVVLHSSGGTYVKSTYSLSFDGINDYARVNRSVQDDFTIEYWIKTSQTSLVGSQWYQGSGIIDASDAPINTNDFGTSLLNGKLAFGIGNPSTTLVSNTTINNGTWHHVAVTRNKSTGAIKLYIDGHLEKTGTANTNSLTAVSYIQLGSLATNANFYNGKIDEIRIWNIEQDSNFIKQDWNRILSGKEAHLAAYYRADDVCSSMIFDSSQDSTGLFHKNHSIAYSGTVLSTDVPSVSQLNFSGLSKANGNYSIDQLPIQGSSEGITITPVYLTHSFLPHNQALAVAKNQTVNGVNFQDSSVFLMTGTVVYKGTPCAAPGIQFTVDGTIQIANNVPITTGNDGTFSLSVPLGQHTVAASKYGHTFQNSYVHDFEAPVSGYQFLDTTLLTVIGSVVGGDVEGSKQPGFGNCVNNIGRANIHLQSVSCNSYTKDILTNPLTGEYSVKLPPMEYQFGGPSNNPPGIQIGSNPLLDFSSLTSANLNLTTYLPLKTVYDTNNNHIDSVQYNIKRSFVYYADPQILVSRQNDQPFKGDSLYTYKSNGGADTSLVLESLPLPLPAFTQGKKYSMKIKTFEIYVNNDGSVPDTNIAPVKQAQIYIANNIADSPVDSIILNNPDGDTLYTFRAGNPNTIADFTKTLELSVKKGDKTATWPTLTAFVFGANAMAGSNFTTTGPDMPFLILRDPPGSNSSSYLETETDIASSSSYSSTYQGTESEEVTVSLGTDFYTGFGIGELFLEENEVKADLSIGAHASESWVDSHTIEETFTTTQRWQTSDAADLPGAKSDLFIGGATNYIFGATNCVYPIRKSACTSCFDTNNYSGFNVGYSSNMFLVPNGYATTFMYTQNHIENYVIPNLISLRNNFVYNAITHGAPSALNPYHINITDPNDPMYGSNNDDPRWLSAASTTTPKITENADTTGSSYVYYRNKWGNGDDDKIRWYNQQIRLWIEALAHNEALKLKSDSKYNLSIGGQTYYEQSMSVEQNREWTSTFEFNLGGEFKADLKKDIFGNGVESETAIGFDYTRDKTTEHDTTKTTTFGYILDDPDIGDQLSIDVKNDHSGNGPVFKLVAGATMCPWEAPDSVKYYTDSIGAVLSGGSMEREKLKANVTPGVPQFNVPYNQPAAYSLELQNLSETNDDMIYNLRVLQETNPNGAVIKINGATVTDYVAFNISGQSSVNATLTVECGPVVFDYENIKLLFYSPCEFDEYNNFGLGYAFDTITVSVHFIPPCKTMDITVPSDLFVVNTNNPDTMNIRIEGTAPIWNYEKSLKVQEKMSNSSDWHDIVRYWKSNLLPGYISGDSIFPQNATVLSYKWPVSAFPDGNYDMRVLGDCGVSQLSSPVISGVFDRICPAPFGNPQPSDGILSAGDELSIQFNEPVDPSSFNTNSFSISGVLNGTAIRHSTSVGFNGTDDFMRMSGVNLASKSFAVEFWMKRTLPSAGTVQTILSQGNDPANCVIIGIDQANKLFLRLKDTIISSNAVVPSDSAWYHWVISYDNTGKLVEFYKDATLLASLPANKNYLNYSDVYLAKPAVSTGYSWFNGSLHELRIWGKPLGLVDFFPNIARTLSGRETGLIGCWPMDEGSGTLIRDIAHSRNATLTNGTWQITPAGKAFDLGSNSYAVMNTQTTVFTADQDFSLEFWFKSGNGVNACLFSNGSGDTNLYNRNTWSVKTNSGGMLQVVNNGTTTNIASGYFDNQWHHFAMSVNRLGNLSVYLDGIYKAGQSGFLYSGFLATKTYLGTQVTLSAGPPVFSDFYTGSLDEVRIWNLWRTREQITGDMNFRLTGNEIGLLQYYPFEKDTMMYGVNELTPTLNNIADTGSLIKIGTQANYDNNGPAIKVQRSVSAVNFTYLLNEDKIIFTPTTPNAQIENCILDITVQGVKDLHGNSMKSPVTWTAYVDRNPIVWGSQVVTLSKNLYDPLSFTVTLTNKGGNIESYSITGLPSWLTCSPQSGTLSPTGSEDITFTVNPGLNIGHYIVDIPAASTFGYDETFVLDLAVIAPPPNWTVNPADYAYTMNVIGELAIDSVLSADPNDIIAAFYGNVCRGVGHLQYFSAVDKWEVFLDVYNDSIVCNQPFKFKIWDASEGVIRSEVTPDLNFAADAVLGTILNPVYINATDSRDQYIPLNTGWNWFSLNLTSPNITNVDYVLQDVQATSADVVKAQNAFDQYLPGTGWIGNLMSSGHFKNTQMYMIKVDHPDTIRFVGKVVDPAANPITLHNGWNWIGFIPQTNFTVNEALANYLQVQNGDVVKGQSAFAMYQNGMGWLGSLSFMKPGNGYMFRSLDTATNAFNYPQNGTGLKNLYETHRMPVVPLTWNNNMARYEYNLSLVARVDMGAMGTVNDSMMLGAFVNNICRGYITPTLLESTNDYLFFLPVNSSLLNGETVSFRLFDPAVSAEYNIIEKLAFEANSVPGNIEHPVLLTLSSTTAGIKPDNVLPEYYLQFRPNPFKDEAIISYSLAEDAHVTITAYNVLGEKISVLADKQMQRGVWSLTWNGVTENGAQLAPGVYYIGMKANKFTSQIKVIIIK